MAIADDDIRVWVDDDQLIIHPWQGQAAGLVYSDHAPHYDTRTVLVAYFNAAANAMANVNRTAKK